MGDLFTKTDIPETSAANSVAVAIAANLWRDYDYLWPGSWPPAQVGMRVKVPFGRSNKLTNGFVVRAAPPVGAGEGHKLKICAELVDNESQLDEKLLELAKWISDYYLCPLGLVLPAFVPTAVGKHAPKNETVVFLDSEAEKWPAKLGPKQKRLLNELLQAKKQGSEPLALQLLLRHAEASRGSFSSLLQKKLIRTEQRPVELDQMIAAGLGKPKKNSTDAANDEITLNEDQQKATETIINSLGKGFSSILLHGVTGSGKTEVYIRSIREATADGGQAILMAPEIALATQTLVRLAGRLSDVAILHSGLTDAQRAYYYQQIRSGKARVIIGPRSAVFAPAENLKLIIVDEEHEPSYRQDNAPRYHGRDVAVKRAHIADIPIVLGSATPSLESYANAKAGRYQLVKLPSRVKGLPMPQLKLVHLRKDLRPGKLELIGRTLTHEIASTLDDDHQVILLMNRRGYASFVFCPSCQWEMQCTDCSRAMVYHQATQTVLCHYCNHSATLPEYCPACSKKLLLFGLGIQRIEDELARKFPTAAVARMDSDTMTSPSQFAKLLDDFRCGNTDILLGTQMVAKGLDFPRVALVGVVSADTSLAISDFRAAERTFQLIVQTAGRAGRSERGGKVVVQTLHAAEPAIQLAVNHDYEGFVTSELPLRHDMKLPPASRLIRLLVRSESAQKCQEATDALAEKLRAMFLPGSGISLIGPMIAPVARIRKQFRRHILLTSSRAGVLQAALRPQLDTWAREIGAELIADVDPVSLA